eukprot:gene5894-6579_t
MDEQALHALAVGDGKTRQDYVSIFFVLQESTIRMTQWYSSLPRCAPTSLLLAYFEQLKNTNEGWKLCSEALAKNIYSNSSGQASAISLSSALSGFSFSGLKYANSSKLVLAKISNKGPFLKMEICSDDQKLFIKKKTAQIVCLLFVREYPSKWLTFFKEVMELIVTGPKAVEMYLMMLLAIDEEVVARHIPHSHEEMERNTNIKDSMRVHCVPDLVNSWFNLLMLYDNVNAELTCLCLEVIGAYVSWIDINLIANERFIGKILQYFSREELRESACDCFHEIVNKGMEPMAKTSLIESLTDALENVGILSPVEGEDLDFVAKVAKLINGMGVQLLSCCSKLPKANGEISQSTTILQAIERKIPYLLRFLSHDDDDISETVSEFAHSYLGFLKQMKHLPSQHAESLKKLLCIVITKMKYEEDYNFDDEGEDEVMFLEFRKQMKVLIDNIGKIDGELVVKTFHEYVRNTFQNLESASCFDTELGVHLIYKLGEALPGQDLYTDPQKFSALQDMMTMLVTSRVSYIEHVAVRLQFFETVTRYERFFYAQTQHIPIVLEAFVDERGLRNPSPRICSRASYLLMRFVKVLKTQMQPFSDKLLRQFINLLVDGKDCNYKNFSKMSADDLYYLYELSAILITCSGATPEVQCDTMKCLLSPVMIRFTYVFSNMEQIRFDELALLNAAQELQSLMAFVSRASKAFSSQLSLKNSGCSQCFTEALPIFLQSLTTPCHRDIIHSGVRQYLHRMIICLGDELLPYLPVAVTHLLKDCAVRDIQEFIPLINQLIARFKTLIAPFLCEVFLPVVNTIFSIFNEPMDTADMQAFKERQLLRRSYYLFLCTIVNNDIAQVITSLGAEDMKNILFTVVQGATDVQDPQVLQEMAQTLRIILNRRGLELVNYLQHTYFPQLNCPLAATSEYCNALRNMDAKRLKIFLKDFYSKWRTQYPVKR